MSLIHPEDYINSIKNACMNTETFAEVKLTPESYEAAISAVGLTVQASEYNDFAVVRPPGHHAGREKTSGFCLFNNIAIAAQKLVNEGKRVFIFDFDGHHGDGTQAIFYNSDQVYYFSLHQAYAFPFTGFPNEKGEGVGEGYTTNFPIFAGGGDKAFMKGIDMAISEAKQFEADVIAVSAGFDAYINDRLLGLNFSLKSYYECGFKLRRSFRNIFAVLEGGYHFELRDCVESFIEGVKVGSRPPKDRFDHSMSVG
ncbi:MAG: hypothetical protein R2764_07240 [Bacteroidales bacterium]